MAKGLYYGNEWFNKIDRKEYFDKYKKVLDFLLAKSTIDIAVLEDNPNVIIGYIVYEDNKLHWIYVKKAWRKAGVGKQLIPEGITCVTHLTKIAAKKKPKEWTFNPLIT